MNGPRHVAPPMPPLDGAPMNHQMGHQPMIQPPMMSHQPPTMPFNPAYPPAYRPVNNVQFQPPSMTTNHQKPHLTQNHNQLHGTNSDQV